MYLVFIITKIIHSTIYFQLLKCSFQHVISTVLCRQSKQANDPTLANFFFSTTQIPESSNQIEEQPIKFPAFSNQIGNQPISSRSQTQVSLFFVTLFRHLNEGQYSFCKRKRINEEFRDRSLPRQGIQEPAVVIAFWTRSLANLSFLIVACSRSSLRLEDKLKRKRDFENRREFKRIRHLEPETVQKLDKLRYDLQESIERTSRIQQAFLKQLNKESLHSNRIKHIISAIELIPFYSDSQRKIVDETISTIIRSKEEKQKEAEKKRKEEDRRRKLANCSNCYCEP